MAWDTGLPGSNSLSGKYESGNDPGKIANTKGDIGGWSYGINQLTAASGYAQKFADSYGGALKGLKAGTKAFNTAWQAEAKKNAKKFADAQTSYVNKSHYEPAANAFTKVTGINLNKASMAIKEVIKSIGIQHGAGGATSLFKAAGITKNMSDETIIKRLYNERRKVDVYFKSSSAEIKAGVKNRLFNEEKNRSRYASQNGWRGYKIGGQFHHAEGNKCGAIADRSDYLQIWRRAEREGHCERCFAIVLHSFTTH